MNNQNNQQDGYASFNANQSDAYSEQKSAYSVPVQQVYQYDPMQQPIYPQIPVESDNGFKTLGILSVVFSSVGIGCCGVQFSIIGIILGIISMVRAKNLGQKSNYGMTGIILGAIAAVLYIILIIAYFSLFAATLSSTMSNLY